MATQRINFATINKDSLKALSDFNLAFHKLRELREVYKAESAKIAEKRASIIEQRDNALAEGRDRDTVLAQFSTLEVDNQQRALDTKYENDCKPFKDMKKSAMELVDVNLYYGYLLAQKNGSLDSKGSITIKKGKNSNRITIDKGYKTIISEFLDTIGCTKTDCETAVSKFVQTMAVRTSGMIKCNKGADYVKVKSASQYNELFMANFLQFLVVERGLLVENDDFSLEMKQF